MRAKPHEKLEEGRFRAGGMRSNTGDLHGLFMLQGPTGARIRILSSGPDEEAGWEHVSVSIEHRTPNWREMSLVKDLFWGDEECVVQFHPPKSEYVNYHPNCLHLWRPMRMDIPLPPSELVGPKAVAL